MEMLSSESAVDALRSAARCGWEGQGILGSKGGAVQVGGVVHLIPPMLSALLAQAHVPALPSSARLVTS
jgi:hypothetical protein